MTFSRKESETMQDNKERKMSENTGSFIKKKRQYQEMGMKILHTCRSEICARFPFFSYASAALSAVVETKMFPNSMENENSSQSWIHGIGTDGERIIADPVFPVSYTHLGKAEISYLHPRRLPGLLPL